MRCLLVTTAITSKCVWIRKSVVKGRMHQIYSKQQGHDRQLKHEMRRGNKVLSHLQKCLPFFSIHAKNNSRIWQPEDGVQKEQCVFYFSASCRNVKLTKNLLFEIILYLEMWMWGWENIVMPTYIYTVRNQKTSYPNQTIKKMKLNCFLLQLIKYYK